MSAVVEIAGRDVLVAAVNVYLRLTEGQQRAMRIMGEGIEVGMGRTVGRSTANALERKELVRLADVGYGYGISLMTPTPFGEDVQWYAEHGAMK